MPFEPSNIAVQSPIKRGLDTSYVNVVGGTVSGRVLKTAGAQEFWAGIYDSAALNKFKVGQDGVNGRYGFATADEALAKVDEILTASFVQNGRA